MYIIIKRNGKKHIIITYNFFYSLYRIAIWVNKKQVEHYIRTRIINVRLNLHFSV